MAGLYSCAGRSPTGERERDVLNNWLPVQSDNNSRADLLIIARRVKGSTARGSLQQLLKELAEAS